MLEEFLFDTTALVMDISLVVGLLMKLVDGCK